MRSVTSIPLSQTSVKHVKREQKGNSRHYYLIPTGDYGGPARPVCPPGGQTKGLVQTRDNWGTN